MDPLHTLSDEDIIEAARNMPYPGGAGSATPEMICYVMVGALLRRIDALEGRQTKAQSTPVNDTPTAKPEPAPVRTREELTEGAFIEILRTQHDGGISALLYIGGEWRGVVRGNKRAGFYFAVTKRAADGKTRRVDHITSQNYKTEAGALKRLRTYAAERFEADKEAARLRAAYARHIGQTEETED